jgi:hypothetical protein
MALQQLNRGSATGKSLTTVRRSVTDDDSLVRFSSWAPGACWARSRCWRLAISVESHYLARRWQPNASK